MLDRLSLIALRLLWFACPVLLLGLPGGMIYDRLSPWPGEAEALARYAPDPRYCLGYGAFRVLHDSGNGPVGRTYLQRLFVLFPDVLKTPQIITLTRSEGVITAERSPAGLWLVAIFYAVCGWGAWALRRPRRAPAVSDPRP